MKIYKDVNLTTAKTVNIDSVNSTSENSLKIPIKDINTFPVQQKGSIVQNSSNNFLYISTGTNWITSGQGGSSSGIKTINGNSKIDQFIIISSSGNSPNIDSASGITKVNIPRASSTASGIITTGTQSFSGNKTFRGNLTVSGIFTASGIIKRINGNSNPSQIINIGTTGLKPNIDNSVGGTTSINIPNASTTASGIITTGTQSLSGNKTFLGNVNVNGTITGGTVNSNGNINALAGTITGATVNSNGNINATNNITGLEIFGRNRLTNWYSIYLKAIKRQDIGSPNLRKELTLKVFLNPSGIRVEDGDTTVVLPLTGYYSIYAKTYIDANAFPIENAEFLIQRCNSGDAPKPSTDNILNIDLFNKDNYQINRGTNSQISYVYYGEERQKIYVSGSMISADSSCLFGSDETDPSDGKQTELMITFIGV